MTLLPLPSLPLPYLTFNPARLRRPGKKLAFLESSPLIIPLPSFQIPLSTCTLKSIHHGCP